VRWRLHLMAVEPIDEEADRGIRPRAARLLPRRAAYPSGTCIVRFLAGRAGLGGLRLYVAASGDDPPGLVHEFSIPPSGRVDHLVYLPRGAEELILRSADGSPLPAISRFRIYELGTLPLTTLLLARWAGRQLREPRRAWPKLANAGRVLFREGIKGAASGLVTSQSARQALESQRLGSGGGGRYAYSGGWTTERYPPAPVPKREIDRAWRRELRSFLGTRARLRLPDASDPSLSIVVVTYNHAARSLSCLRSIAEHAPAGAEVIIVDNASSDETPSLLQRVEGARILVNEENLGFLRACNQAVAHALGDSILLLNNDALLLPGSIEAALGTLESSEAVGVVGGRLIGLDGRLQEAGSIIWRDGSCRGYGRGDDPNAPEYRFRRDVDFVSGAFLLTRRRLWEQLGGFDEAFVPAYYEDADYCVRARATGWRVVYEPNAAVVHYEYGSSSPAIAQAGMRRNQTTFMARHGGALVEHPTAGPGSELSARTAPPNRRRLLMVDDRVPLATDGSGAPRAASILRALVSLGWEVTLYPALPFLGTWRDIYGEVPPEVEVMLGCGREQLGRFLSDRKGTYARFLVSRVHNMALVNQLVAREPDLLGDASVVYDSEAIGALRYTTAREALGDPLSSRETQRLVQEEVNVARGAHRVTAVSSEEVRVFERSGVRDVHLVSHGIALTPTKRPFHLRRSLLFVGRLVEEGSPNVDALLWFLDHVYPLLRKKLTDDVPQLVVAGKMSAVSVPERAGAGVQLLGPVRDLTPLYEDARVFIAPHRFAAGAPFKVIDAAAHGVPVAATDLLGRQLDWAAGRDLLAASVGDAESFAANCVRLFLDERLWSEVRRSAAERVARGASMEVLTSSLARALA